MRVIQLLPTLAYGDAMGNDVLAMRDIIQSWGYETGIWAYNIDEKLPAGTANRAETLPPLRDDDVIIYHGGIGSDWADRLPDFPGRKVLIYHNVTPPSFFQELFPYVASECQRGLNQMRALSDSHTIDYCIADSEFNKRDLLGMGYACPIDVCPILIPFQDYVRTPTSERMGFLDDGRVNVLFVGRGSPNKRQDDVVRAFYAYHRCFNPDSRLVLVGGWIEPLLSRTRALVRELGLSDAVVIPEHVPFSDLLFCYQSADVFLSMSEHEGFGVPLAESMYFDIPIVAYASSAVPWTLGGGGVLLEKKSPLEAAWRIHRLMEDEDHLNRVLEAQRRRLKDFSYENVSAILEKTLLRFLKEGEEKRPIRKAAPHSRPARKRKERRLGGR